MNLPPLGALITAANQARSAYTTGQQQGQQEKLKLAMQQVAMQRQEQEDALKAAFMKAQTSKLLQPPPAPRDYVGEHAANRRFDIENPLPVKAGPPEALEVTVGPDGKRIYTPRSQAAGMHAPGPTPSQAGVFVDAPNQPGVRVYTPQQEAFGKTLTGGQSGNVTGMGSGGIGGLARTSAGITGMQNADDVMRPFEEAARTGKADYTGLDYFQGQYAKLYDSNGVKDKAAHALAFSQLNKTNPQLANYLRAAEQWSLEDATISGRPSDFRTKLDAFISAIGPNAGGEHIDQVQHFRGTRLATLTKFQPAIEAMAERAAGRGGGRGNAPGTVQAPQGPEKKAGPINLSDKPPASREQALWDAAVAKYGRAVVEQKYGPRP